MAGADAPGMMLMTVECPAGKPTVESVAHKLGVPLDAIDRKFGVIAVDPDRHLYSVRVRADAAAPSYDSKGNYRGPFSNPKIAPFGPKQ
jgi:hypothetical protein